jgi:hypothetical protein
MRHRLQLLMLMMVMRKLVLQTLVQESSCRSWRQAGVRHLGALLLRCVDDQRKCLGLFGFLY